MAMAPGEASISVLSRIPSRSRIPEPVLQPTNPILQGLPGTSEGQLLPGECPDRKEGNLFRLVPCSRFSPDDAGEVDDGHDRRSLVGIDVQQGKLLDLQRNLFSGLPHRRLLDALTEFDVAGGKGPLPPGRLDLGPEEEPAPVVDGNPPGHHLRVAVEDEAAGQADRPLPPLRLNPLPCQAPTAIGAESALLPQHPPPSDPPT